jgi:RNA polymerase sigma factor (sigma-70 family)
MRHLPEALDRDETQDLLTAYRSLGPEEREGGALEARIIDGNLRFAVHLARRFEETGKATGAELEDLFSCATEALLKAVREYDPRVSLDPDGRNSFSGWAQRLMMQALVAFVKARPNSSEQPLDMATSLDAFAGTGLADDVAGEEEPEADALQRIEAERLTLAVATLPDRDAHIVRLRFGLAGLAPHELAEIGTIVGLSKQRVQVILDQALVTLRGVLSPGMLPQAAA